MGNKNVYLLRFLQGLFNYSIKKIKDINSFKTSQWIISISIWKNTYFLYLVFFMKVGNFSKLQENILKLFYLIYTTYISGKWLSLIFGGFTDLIDISTE